MTRHYISTYDLHFREISDSHFIWLPLKDVPVTEIYPINSLEQPALSTYKLLEWNSAGDTLADNQQYLSEFARLHGGEMGYFLLHYEGRFGIIGVTEYNDYYGGEKPGRATIFNARKPEMFEDNEDIEPIELTTIFSPSAKLSWKEVEYKPGHLVDWQSIRVEKPDLDWYD